MAVNNKTARIPILKLDENVNSEDFSISARWLILRLFNGRGLFFNFLWCIVMCTKINNWRINEGISAPMFTVGELISLLVGNPIHTSTPINFLLGKLAITYWKRLPAIIVQRLTNLCQKSSLKAPGFLSQNIKAYRMVDIALTKSSILVVTYLCRIKVQTHDLRPSGPCKSLTSFKTWTVLFQVMKVQHIEATNWFIMVRFLSDPNLSIQMML